MDKTACNVCTEVFNKKYKRLTCSSCEYEVCSKCVERYFETSKATPQCMQCHRPWNHQFIIENLGKSSNKRINNVQKELLYNEQKSLFPHTQGYLSLKNQYTANNDRIKILRNQIKNLKNQVNDICNENIRINNTINRIDADFLENHGLTDNGLYIGAKKDKKTYIQACGVLECKGYIGTNGVCGICATLFCTKCMVVKNENHLCNPDDVLSLELIKKDSKHCPKCNCLIHRISGCPDMFCTACYTTFNWNSLKIDYNGNSNPMYYRWLREGYNNNNDNNSSNNNCEMVTMTRVFSSSNYKNQLKSFQTCLSKALQSLDHSNRYAHYNYNTYITRENDTNYETLTLQTRTKFMSNKITEKNFKTQLMRIHKAKEFNNNITQIKDMINLYRIDMMRTIASSESFDVNTCLQEYVQFSEYINNCVSHLKVVFYNHKPTNDATTGFIQIPSQILNRNM